MKALNYLSKIIELQLGFLFNRVIPGTAGSFFIPKFVEYEAFIKEYYLPRCPLVGPYYSVENKQGKWSFIDWDNYEEKDIRDEEFVELFNNRKPEQMAPTTRNLGKNIIEVPFV